MRKRQRSLLLIVFLSVGSFSFSSVADESPLIKSPKLLLEPLYHIEFGRDQLSFGVKSNGCTADKHFIVSLASHDGEINLVVERTEKDRCRRMPKIIEITKELDYSGIDPNLPIRVLNPFKQMYK